MAQTQLCLNHSVVTNLGVRCYECAKEERLQDIARGAIERNLGDVVDENGEASADALYDEAFVLAHDALLDRGVEPHEATRIAQQEAQKIAQP